MAYASRDGTSNALRAWVGLVSFLQVQPLVHLLSAGIVAASQSIDIRRLPITMHQPAQLLLL